MRVKIGLAQIYPKLGDVAHNLGVHLNSIEEARASGVDLLVFPELSLTGYQVQDLVPEVALRVGWRRFGLLPNSWMRAPISTSSSASCMRTAAIAFTSATPISPAASWSTCITSSTCPPTPCSTNRATSPKATACAPSTRALAASACSSARTSGMSRHPTCSGLMAPIS